MEPIRLWRTTEGDWRKTNGGAFNVTEYAALTRADFDALAAEAADARTLRAERDSLVKERDEASRKWNAAVYDADKVRTERDRAEREWHADTARADAASDRLARAEALLREARAGWAAALAGKPVRCADETFARIDAHLEGKA